MAVPQFCAECMVASHSGNKPECHIAWCANYKALVSFDRDKLDLRRAEWDKLNFKHLALVPDKEMLGMCVYMSSLIVATNAGVYRLEDDKLVRIPFADETPKQEIR